MITVTKVLHKDVADLVAISYKDDYAGFEKYHIKPMDYWGAVSKTLDMIWEMEEQNDMDYYEIKWGDNRVGYMITCDECLYSFAIQKEYRVKRGLLVQFWIALKLILGKDFICLIYRNNTRAIKFLQRMGMEEIEYNTGDKNLITLINLS